MLIGLALGRESQLGYVEGPPLAFWLLDLAYGLGGSVLVADLLPALSVALTGWLVFAFARQILGERHGAIATLLMVGVHPVAFPVGAFDADILQMPLVAASVLVWWNGAARRQPPRALWARRARVARSPIPACRGSWSFSRSGCSRSPTRAPARR